jgi:hypothetical protein
MLPPFPTRLPGQVCSANADCVSWPGYETRCEEQVCQYVSQRSAEISPIPPDRPLRPADDAAMAAANTIAALEVAGDLYDLYRSMHPDAQAIVQRETMIGWYMNEFTRFGEPAPRAVKIRFVSWTWDVTGRTYPDTADVALRQDFPDGRVVRDEIRLVKDHYGTWGWFFGRTRSFVEQQIARFPTFPEGTSPIEVGQPCTTQGDCRQTAGATQCVSSRGTGVEHMICLRDPGGFCQSSDDCNPSGGSARCLEGRGPGFKPTVCLREAGGACRFDRDCLDGLTCNSGTCGDPA